MCVGKKGAWLAEDLGELQIVPLQCLQLGVEKSEDQSWLQECGWQNWGMEQVRGGGEKEKG